MEPKEARRQQTEASGARLFLEGPPGGPQGQKKLQNLRKTSPEDRKILQSCLKSGPAGKRNEVALAVAAVVAAVVVLAAAVVVVVVRLVFEGLSLVAAWFSKVPREGPKDKKGFEN